MKKYQLLFLLLTSVTTAISQRVHIGILGGASAYNGDLVDKIFPKKVTNGIIGFTGNYEITDQITARVGLAYTIVGGTDRDAKPTDSLASDLRLRNLSFETKIWEFTALGEYYLFNLNNRRYSPYVMAGIAVYNFNPYANNGGTKVYLKPLSTEGQGISGYGKNYSLIQIALPVGIGLKYVLTENLRIGAEFGYRKLFTDFLDDVSGNYADPADLLEARGQLSVDMSYRGDEVGASPTYPAKGSQRGNPEHKDAYYYAGLHLTYCLNNGSGPYGSNKYKTGCPVNVY